VEARAAAERAMGEDLGVDLEIALGPGGFMGGEESALLAVLESRRAMARQRPPYPASQGLHMRPTLVASAETLAWLPLIATEQARASTKLVSVTGAVVKPGVYEVALGSPLSEILAAAGGASGKLKGIHVGGPTGGILAASRMDTRFDFDDLRVAGTHMGSAQVRAIPAGTCIVNEAATLFAYLAKESCAICVPCRVGTKRVQAILESTYSGLGRDSDLAWLDELGTHMERFSLCGFGITAPSILRTTMREFADDYRIHIQEKRCPEAICKPIRSRRYETMVQP
jgi:NADH:ubiquinone oxidoreductase subunit F (NADH-binding)